MFCQLIRSFINLNDHEQITAHAKEDVNHLHLCNPASGPPPHYVCKQLLARIRACLAVTGTLHDIITKARPAALNLQKIYIRLQLP